MYSNNLTFERVGNESHIDVCVDISICMPTCKVTGAECNKISPNEKHDFSYDLIWCFASCQKAISSRYHTLLIQAHFNFFAQVPYKEL